MNNPRHLYLLAGGKHVRQRMFDPLITKFFEENGLTKPTVAYVGVASDDDYGFFQYMSNILKESGAGQVQQILIVSKNADLNFARKILKTTDTIYISGGDVDEGMRILREKKLTTFLHELYEGGKPFFGLSAGSIMLAKKWIRWRDPNDNLTAELFPCLGFAPVICDTHGEDDGWEELIAALELAEEGEKGYGIVTGTALKVYSSGKVEALGGAIHQFIKKEGKVARIANLNNI